MYSSLVARQNSSSVCKRLVIGKNDKGWYPYAGRQASFQEAQIITALLTEQLQAWGTGFRSKKAVITPLNQRLQAAGLVEITTPLCVDNDYLSRRWPVQFYRDRHWQIRYYPHTYQHAAFAEHFAQTIGQSRFATLKQALQAVEEFGRYHTAESATFN